MIGKKMIAIIGIGCMCMLGAHVTYAAEHTPAPVNQNEQKMDMYHKCPHSPMQKVIESKIMALLKMDANTFYAELAKGKSILQIAEAKGLKKDDLIRVIVKEMSMQIDGHVKDGHISKEKAVWLKKYLPVRAEMFITKPSGKCPGQMENPQKQPEKQQNL